MNQKVSRGYSVVPMNGEILTHAPQILKQPFCTKVGVLSKFVSKMTPSPYEQKSSSLRAFIVESSKMLHVQIGVENLLSLVDRVKTGQFKKVGEVMGILLGQELTVRSSNLEVGAKARTGLPSPTFSQKARS